MVCSYLTAFLNFLCARISPSTNTHLSVWKSCCTSLYIHFGKWIIFTISLLCSFSLYSSLNSHSFRNGHTDREQWAMRWYKLVHAQELISALYIKWRQIMTYYLISNNKFVQSTRLIIFWFQINFLCFKIVCDIYIVLKYLNYILLGLSAKILYFSWFYCENWNNRVVVKQLE